MTDHNEKLIKEAAQAIQNLIWTKPFGHMITNEEAARAALAVFEKAHTPTDDEREATQELCDRCGWATSGHLRSQYGLDCPPGGSRPGFRRSEVPETRSCGEVHPTTAHLLPHAEPQGEPSDAQVDAAGELLYGISWGTDIADPDLVRAALRAAGGEGR